MQTQQFLVTWIDQQQDKTKCFQIREKVFVKEQGFENEFDEIDETAYHLLIQAGENPIATARIFQQDDKWMIGRVCVIPPYRKHGVGRIAVEECEKQIQVLGGHSSHLSAQLRIQGFYESMGYHAEGEPYLDEFCPHIAMSKQLD